MTDNKFKIALSNAPYRSFDEHRAEFNGRHPTNGVRILGGEVLERELADDVKIFDGSLYDSFSNLIEDINNYNPDVLGIPCVIDVERATDVLEDGMKVEVDANEGKIKRLGELL